MAAERAAKVGTTAALLILVAAALAVYGLDQLSKYLVVTNLTEGEVVPVLGPVLQWQFVRNPGAAFSLFAQAPGWFRQPFFFLVTGVAIVALSFFLYRVKDEGLLIAVAVSGILAGAVGNLIDRIMYGEVIDFLLFYWRDYHWPAFNVADSCITLGVIGLLWTSLWNSHTTAPQ